MAGRSKGFNQGWDPMQDEFDDSSTPQNGDDRSSLDLMDHCRLHITNIPRALNQDGLYTAFSKFGNLMECFVSADPDKRYALVAFETPGEAKLAMMKLNRTEPLNLIINIAYKRAQKRQNDDKQRGYNNGGARNRDDRGYRENVSASSSAYRLNNQQPRLAERRQDMANGDSLDNLVEDAGMLSKSMEPDMELELLKLKQLQIQAQQLDCQQRILLIKQKKSVTNTRYVMPDGKIIVRTVESEDQDENFGSGGGDATEMPGLQSGASCVACGEHAAHFCSGCRVTPYCSAACQRQDWTQRHMKVCHNLKRQSGGAGPFRSDPEPAPTMPAPAPLRRPRSPDTTRRDSGSEKGDRPQSRRFGPPGHANAAPGADSRGAPRNSRSSQNDGRKLNRSFEADDDRSDSRPRNDRDRNQQDRNQDRNQQNSRNQERDDKFGRKNTEFNRPRNQGDNNRYQNAGRSGNRDDDEDWGPKPQQKPQEVARPKPPAQETVRAPVSARLDAQARPDAAQARPNAAQARPDAAQARPNAAPARPLATVADVTPKPVSKLVPKNCVTEVLPVGSSFMMMVECPNTLTATPGFVCTVGVADGVHGENYCHLLEPFGEACAKAETFKPAVGDVFGFLDTDGEWYRARLFAPARAMLMDVSRLVSLGPGSKCVPLTSQFADIAEYCCHLETGKVNLGDAVECTVVSRSGATTTVSMAVGGQDLGTAAVRRWLPQDTPKGTVAEAVQASVSQAPICYDDIPRPPVLNNSKVFIVSASDPSRVAIRSAEIKKRQEFSNLLDDAAESGEKATNKLKELPTPGQLVLAFRADQQETYYRAVVKKVSTKHGKCLLEFTELGDSAVELKLDNMCPCPTSLDLSSRPPLVSLVSLPMKPTAFTESAIEYAQRLSDDDIELNLTIPSGEKSGPSGTPVTLKTVSSGEDINHTLEKLSTPQWQQLLDQGKTVFDIEDIHFNALKYVDPPSSGDFDIVDCSELNGGAVYGFPRNAKHALKALALTLRLEEYCNSELAKDPYLPKPEYLCVAFCPQKKLWLRGVNLSQEDGPGSPNARIHFFDYGYSTDVPVTSLRKMMPEFVHGLPAAGSLFIIKDFPTDPTPEQLERAKNFMNFTDTTHGTLKIKKCTLINTDFIVEVPELIRAITQ